jgi:beta-lactamase regulating signal transducer with metallopeptidase domain
VLLHELGHIKRRDPLVALVCLGLQILYWFHPLVWMVRVRLATLREIACDADVVALASRDEYRRTLLRLARPLAVNMGGLGFFARRSELITRLMILERPVPPALSPWLRRCATALLFAAVFGGAVAVDSAATKRPAPLDPEGLTLQGCLQLRYAVYAMMAEERRNQEPQR